MKIVGLSQVLLCREFTALHVLWWFDCAAAVQNISEIAAPLRYRHMKVCSKNANAFSFQIQVSSGIWSSTWTSDSEVEESASGMVHTAVSVPISYCN